MVRSTRLKIVVELAQREENSAANEFQIAQKKLDIEKAKLNDLEQYYQGYQQHFNVSQTALRASDLQKSRLFLQQLADAISSQQKQTSRAENAALLKQALWHKSHLRCKSISELVQRYRKEENIALDKKDQKMVDEWFNQVSAKNST